MGDSQSEMYWKEMIATKSIDTLIKVKQPTAAFTFVKLMSLRANTAKALNSTPAPSSNVKTMLVWEENSQILL